MPKIVVQTEIFDIGAETNLLAKAYPNAGAVASFVGYVRNHNQNQIVTSLELEHYPGMTEKVLAEIVDEAIQRWSLLDVTVIHRVGVLQLQEPIVLVLVASAHRQAAFDGCAFIMDFLKSKAPFWKKEHTEAGSIWVDARESDAVALSRWL